MATNPNPGAVPPNEAPVNAQIMWGLRSDGKVIPVSLDNSGNVNINGSISASLGAFNPTGIAQIASVGVATSRVALANSDASVLLRNTGATDCFFKLGDVTVTAALTDYLLKAGESVNLATGGATYVAAITASSTTTLKAWSGTGLTVLTSPAGSGGGGSNVNLNQVGGAAYALGAAAKAASMPVTIATDDPLLSTLALESGGHLATIDAVQGAVADAAWTSGSGTVIALLKAMAAKIIATVAVTGTVTANAGTNLNTSTLALEAGGHLAAVDAVQGAVADAAWTSGSGTVVALLKAIAAKIIATVAVTQSGTWTVQPGNTPNTAPWLVGHGKTIKTATVNITADTDIVAAVSSKRIKVIAYALFKTGTNANPILFKSNGTGGTELARVLLQSQASAVFGANLAIAAPSFLFATVAGEKLTMDVGDTDTLSGFITYFDDDAV